MCDFVKIYIYDTDILLKISIINESLNNTAKAQNFNEQQKELFAPAALLAATLATEEKEDSGSIFVSLKSISQKLNATAFCETDGRLRGYAEDYDEQIKEEILLISGRRLVLRGDYTSAIADKSIELAVKNYYKNSRQTIAKTKFNLFGSQKSFISAEYFPGHNTVKNEADKASFDEINKKAEDALNAAEFLIENNFDLQALKNIGIEPGTLITMPEFPLHFGCSCSKRKIKTALGDTEGISFPIEISCKFCGKIYYIEQP